MKILRKVRFREKRKEKKGSKKIQDFSRTFQDPMKNFPGTFSEPGNVKI